MNRFERQLPIVGDFGQKKLSESTVALIGCGGIGTNVATMLASAGVGVLILADGDSPDITNLNRQYVYREGQTEKKAVLLGEWIKEIYPDIEVVSYPMEITKENTNVLDGADVIVDCLDNIPARLILNDYVFSSDKPLVHGAVSGMFGQVTTVIPRRTPCLNCLLTSGKTNGPSPSISPAVSFVASVQASEVIKIITGIGTPLLGRLLVFDLSDDEIEVVDIKPKVGCSVCGK